ncbi:very short patch repair endonuclease [Chitinophaga sp. 22321]|uniref:Very short patch repair endonuclease n=1 Tax=Chitinophaga hostae TaxID=2831022 RepID=A0ABS5IT17_9BACT|nr:DNA mismatch endonuclease Vsr [Chitinophaga hostae]MBS0026056.1 DNA mismatch endonuclease Vsr [Chitinophaga hostae]
MADVHSKETRSYNMSRIKSKDTKPEIIVRKFLFSHGFRFRLHDKKLPGKPDIVLPKYHAAIFIHGCFWHGHENCKYFVVPKTRTEWWMNKILINRNNDIKSVDLLQKMGWKVLVLWECELKGEALSKTLTKLLSILES